MTINLPDDRVDAMRTEVLDAVDADIARRGRRARRTIAGGVGALALATVIGISVPTLGGGDSGGSADVALERDTATATAPQAAPETEFSTKDSAGSVSGPSDADYAAGQREIVTTGSVTVTVKDTAGAANRFSAWVTKHGGRVDGRTETREDDGHTSATLVVRVPNRTVNAAVRELRGYGTVDVVDLQRDDVTAEGRDLDARIKALRISVARLEAILNRGASTDQVIAAETALSERQQELESLLAQRRALSDQVSLSTIDVSFSPENKPGSVAPGGFRGGLIKGWNALVDTVNAIVTTLGALVPWLGIALLAGIVWRIARRVRRARTE